MRTVNEAGPGPGAPAAAEPQRSRLGRWAQEHRLLISVVVAVAVLAYDQMYLLQMVVVGAWSTPLYVAASTLSVTMSIAFVLRHRRALPVFLVVLGAAAAQFTIGISLTPAPLVLLWLVLRTLADRYDWRVVVPALVATSVWAVVAGARLVEIQWARIGDIGVIVLAYVIAALLGVLARNRRARFDALQERAAQLARERDSQAEIAAAEERSRIAREIHDIVSHGLGTMVVMADGAARTSEADPSAAGQAMARVRDTGREAMTEMRRMLDVLRDDEPALHVPQPGLGQLEELLASTRATGLRVDLTTSGEAVELSSGIDLAAYRIVQEALTNARTHGGPRLSTVGVSVDYLDDAVELGVVDDGRSPASAEQAAGGHGLVGMRERVAAYGGSLTTGARTDGGFEVRARLPYGGGR